MSIYTDLLFLHGHVADPGLARQLVLPRTEAPDAQPSAPVAVPETDPRPATSASYRPRSWRYPMRLFQAMLPLDEAPASTARFGIGDVKYAPTYGNRTAWERRFPGFGTQSHAQPRHCQA